MLHKENCPHDTSPNMSQIYSLLREVGHKIFVVKSVVPKMLKYKAVIKLCFTIKSFENEYSLFFLSICWSTETGYSGIGNKSTAAYSRIRRAPKFQI